MMQDEKSDGLFRQINESISRPLPTDDTSDETMFGPDADAAPEEITAWLEKKGRQRYLEEKEKSNAGKLIKVWHHNLFGHEINESLEFGYPQPDREIYCKRLHKVTEPMAIDCNACPYFAGMEMGHGIECAWDDVVPDERTSVVVGNKEVLIRHEDAHKEFERVSKLIEEGILNEN